MGIISPNKIHRCFTAAQASYDQHATVQQHIVQKLVALLPPKAQFKHVLEIGCGTGSLTRALHEKCEINQWEIVDLCDCQTYLAQILPSSNFHFHQANAEYFSIDTHVNLIATASTVQWFKDKQAFLRRSATLLEPNGLLLFSTFGERNLLEIKQLTGVGLDYPNLTQWQQWLESDFEILHLSEADISLSFNNPQTVLRHLKSTGVTATSHQMWTKQHLHHFIQDYENTYPTSDGGVSLRYHPIYVLARYRG